MNAMEIADKNIAKLISKLCDEYGHYRNSDEDDDNIIRRIAELRASMAPQIVSEEE